MERSRWNRTPTSGPEAQCSAIELTPLNHLTQYSRYPTISFIFFKGFIFTALWWLQLEDVVLTGYEVGQKLTII